MGQGNLGVNGEGLLMLQVYFWRDENIIKWIVFMVAKFGEYVKNIEYFKSVSFM